MEGILSSGRISAAQVVACDVCWGTEYRAIQHGFVHYLAVLTCHCCPRRSLAAFAIEYGRQEIKMASGRAVGLVLRGDREVGE